jgi:branched-chain amino acid transport system permease protein
MMFKVTKSLGWKNPQDSWAPDAPRWKPRMLPVGRLRWYWKGPAQGSALWRLRYPFTRRTVLRTRGVYNPKTLRAERTIVDRRPIYWALGLALLALLPPFVDSGALLAAGAVFCIYAAINLCWMLTIGTAGIFSLASPAVVGAAAYGSSWLAIEYGLPWWTLPFIGSGIGLVFGAIIAIPATRLDGFYYALLTLGINELCRVYVVQSRVFGSATGGLYGAPSYMPEGWDETSQLRLGVYACLVLMIAALFLYRFVNGTRLGRILRAAPEKKEAFAEATGIDFRSARVRVFLISSIALGVIGGFYATHFRGASPTLFSFDLVLMMLAMIVIGGLGRAEGAVVGTLIVIFIEKYLIDWGPARLILIGLIMLGVVLFLRGGLFGMKQQFRAWRNKKKSERRSTRAEKGGEMLPEEATETRDKDQIFARRFDKQQRDFLKTLVTDDVIEEHRAKPLGQHSEQLERLLVYFRRGVQNDKYAIVATVPFKEYRVIALSGFRGVAPRVVDDKVYATEDEAYHGVFLRRVQDLLES